MGISAAAAFALSKSGSRDNYGRLVSADTLTYLTMNDRLAMAVPAVADASAAEAAWWGGEGVPSHVFFGNVLNPYLSQILRGADEAALIELFHFLERLASNTDPRVQDVLRDTVLEHLRDEPEDHQARAERVMGTATGHHWRQVIGP